MAISAYTPPTIWCEPAETQPMACCARCGQRWGRWHYSGVYLGPPQWSVPEDLGACGVCGQADIPVAAPVQYGLLIRGWEPDRRFAQYRI